MGPYPEDWCLGFVNTLSWRGRSEPVETLHSAADLFNWVEHSKVLPRVSIAEACNWARENEKQAAQGFARAIVFREALFGIFSAIAAGAGVARKDFQILEAALARGPHRHPTYPDGERLRLERTGSAGHDLRSFSPDPLVRWRPAGERRRTANPLLRQ